jgi:protein ImuB
LAQSQGVYEGMAAADARAIYPMLKVFDDRPELEEKLLTRIAEWGIRFTPLAAIDVPNGLIFDASGCTHLWGGDILYIQDIVRRLQKKGYAAQAGIGDTIGAAWAMARYGKEPFIANNECIHSFPCQAMRLNNEDLELLHQLGLKQVRDLLVIPRSALRRRFSKQLLTRIDQLVGNEEEFIQPVIPIEPFQERLPCLEPIITATGIEIALQRLLETICISLRKEGKGIRKAVLKCYKTDSQEQEIGIGTIYPSCNEKHLFKLFELKIPNLQPEPGIELFVLTAIKVEDHSPVQEEIWKNVCGLTSTSLAELLDRVGTRIGADHIMRYLPDEHYWPERSIKPAISLKETSTVEWRTDKRRPIQLLQRPERIQVTAPIPDYPPMNFRYRGKLHTIMKADGPERIEQEWWIEEGQHRDYYQVEDETGCRYWLFRSGHYNEEGSQQWFMHGLFA